MHKPSILGKSTFYSSMFYTNSTFSKYVMYNTCKLSKDIKTNISRKYHGINIAYLLTRKLRESLC